MACVARKRSSSTVPGSKSHSPFRIASRMEFDTLNSPHGKFEIWPSPPWVSCLLLDQRMEVEPLEPPQYRVRAGNVKFFFARISNSFVTHLQQALNFPCGEFFWIRLTSGFSRDQRSERPGPAFRKNKAPGFSQGLVSIAKVASFLAVVCGPEGRPDQRRVPRSLSSGLRTSSPATFFFRIHPETSHPCSVRSMTQPEGPR